MITVEVLNHLLLDLYRASRELTMKEFQLQTLELIRPHIPFDSAWWAMATEIEAGRHRIHDSYLFGLTENFGELASMTSGNNLIARTCSRTPGTSFNFTPEQLFGDAPTAMLIRHSDVMHLLCTAWQGRIPQLFTFLGISRHDRKSPFSEDERRLKQCLMPHLADTMQINRVMHIASIRAGHSNAKSAMAVVDELGTLHAAEPGFDPHVRLEWPDWEGPFLPPALQTALAHNQVHHLGKQVRIRFDRVRELTLVTIARRAPADALSARERAVAEGFASGQSYKEVALHLAISPATVRHHLRSVYEKLGVSDKGELARMLREDDLQFGEQRR